jgi:hypothetical protein
MTTSEDEIKQLRREVAAEVLLELSERIWMQHRGHIPVEDERPALNEHAVVLGRLGGMKGGKARAAKLTAEERSDCARRAAMIRWGKWKVVG